MSGIHYGLVRSIFWGPEDTREGREQVCASEVPHLDLPPEALDSAGLTLSGLPSVHLANNSSLGVQR